MGVDLSKAFWLKAPDGQTGELLSLQSHQEQFVNSESFATFFAGGRGSGKSYALLAWLFKQAFRNPPNTTGMVLMPTFVLLNEFLDECLLPAFKPVLRGHSVGKRVLYLPNGRKLLYRSGHVAENLEASNLCYVGIDEAGLMSRKIFENAVSRVRVARSSKLAIACTGVPVWGWLRDEFENKNDDRRRIIHASTYDNVRTSQEYRDNIADAFSARDAETFIRGRFCQPGGGVYPELDATRHAVDWRYDPKFETGVSIDWSPRRPHAIFYQLLPAGWGMAGGVLQEGGAVIFDEVMRNANGNPITTEELCARIKGKGYRLDVCCYDPAGASVQSTSGVSDVTMLKRHLGAGRYMAATTPNLRSVAVGIMHVRRLLDPISGPPRLYFAKPLLDQPMPHGVWPALMAYGYRKTKSGLDDEPIKDNQEDAADCTRYLAINHFPSVKLASRVYSIA